MTRDNIKNRKWMEKERSEVFITLQAKLTTAFFISKEIDTSISIDL